MRSFTHTQRDRSPSSSSTSTPSQREQNILVFTYATEAHPDDLLTKGGGLKTKSEALAQCVCNEAPSTLWLLLEKCLLHLLLNLF